MFSKELGGRQHRIVPPARDRARRVRVSFVSVSVKWHREENLNRADSCSEFGKAALSWINSADHELRSDEDAPHDPLAIDPPQCCSSRLDCWPRPIQ
jgi:hypothetical protein